MKKMIEVNKFVLTLLVMSIFIAPAYGAVYFQDDFSAFTRWTYTTTSTGHFASNGTYAYLFDGKNENGACTAYKPLERVLPPGDDFSFTLDIRSGADNSNTCGSCYVTLLDTSDNVIAEMGWHDVQASTGYGGLDFYAEGRTAIYRTNPSGFGTEYSSFSGTLMLKRSGSEWSAWVNGIQKGSTLSLSPTLTATKIQIAMGHWALWNERNIELDNLAVAEGIPLITNTFFIDFDCLKEFNNFFHDAGAEWGDKGYAATFHQERVDSILLENVMVLNASRLSTLSDHDKTSRVETKYHFGHSINNPAGTYAAYVCFSGPDPSGIYNDISDQDFYAINLVPDWDPSYSEVDFEWLTMRNWQGDIQEGMSLNSWDQQPYLDNEGHTDSKMISDKPLDQKWTLLLFQVSENIPHEVKYFINNDTSIFKTTKSNCMPDHSMRIDFSNWFYKGKNGEGKYIPGEPDRNYTMKVDWVFYSPSILTPSEVRNVVALRRAYLKIYTTCPVDLEVVDNLGRKVSKTVNEISGANYIETDLDGNGDLDDEIIVPEPNTGAYYIQVIPDSNADPNAPVTLTIEDHGKSTVLLDEVPVSELPVEPLVIYVDRTSPELEVYAYPQVLVPVNGQMVPVAIDIDVNDNDPNVEVALVDITSSNPNDVNFLADANIGSDDREFLLRASINTQEPNDKVYAITYTAIDSTGNFSYASVEVRVPGPESVEGLVDVSCGRVGYDRRTGQFSVDVKVTNNSQTLIGSPVWLVIESISNPAVTLAGGDGMTIDGKPYVDLSGLLGNGQLDPAETISKRIYFNNPNRVQFTFQPSVRGIILP